MVTRNSVDYKIALLRFLLRTHGEFPDPDIRKFWDYIGSHFTHPDVPKAIGNELEEYCDAEVQTWQIECDSDPKRRRKGHEKGSQYDSLMDQWAETWDARLLDHWQHLVTKPGPNQGKFDTVPSEFRAKVKERVAASERIDQKSIQGSAKKTPPRKAKDQPRNSQTEGRNFEYDGEKLERVVEAAKQRACDVGKPDLAQAVNQIYLDALVDMRLRVLLEAILTQEATPKQNEEFQEYVRRAKRKLRDAKAKDEKAQADLKKNSPQVQYSHKQENRSAIKKDKAKAPAVSATQGSVDSGYGSQKDDKVMNDSASGSSVSRSNSEVVDGAKRRRASIPSAEAAEQADLEEAERASKRRKQADDGDDSGNYGQKKAKAVHKHPLNKRGINLADSGSELSEAGDTEIEAAKEAYVDEMVRKKSAEASKQAIEEQYGPVSPTVADNESWRSMPSPSFQTAQPARAAGPNATASVSNSAPGASTAVMRVPSPPPEQLTDDESSHAFKIITGAAAEAMAPAMERLEAKLDSLLSQRPPANPFQNMFDASKSKGKDAATAASQDLVNVADMLQSGDLDLRNPDTTKLISQLARNAAEASIHAAEAARRAGEMARDVSMVLMHLGTKHMGKQIGHGGQRKQE
ncbi:hypothetical protein DOTSEDRAFT_34642 [Dothistroma septosporum NZE10]|uniref:Uncharacterized protein n=1 Tax=Dothistroma septosporum (strain NZE10 / CBS 128990) TaxID=675120 RepID=N1PLD1_DOTSN|nr:hypothetical protein DOTSEDRAFT_34642 [Dothistroma septosporum NZE10]